MLDSSPFHIVESSISSNCYLGNYGHRPTLSSVSDHKLLSTNVLHNQPRFIGEDEGFTVNLFPQFRRRGRVGENWSMRNLIVTGTNRPIQSFWVELPFAKEKIVNA